jgi:hypothetical protein
LFSPNFIFSPLVLPLAPCIQVTSVTKNFSYPFCLEDLSVWVSSPVLPLPAFCPSG